MKLKFVLLALLFTTFLAAQNTKYEIVLFSNVIGNGTCSQSKTAEGLTNYKLYTKANAKIMFKEHTSMSDISMNYKGDVLQSLKLKREKDGEWQNVEITLENGKHYYTGNGEKVLVKKPITFTSTKLFFKEPIGIKEVYIERTNNFVPIEIEEPGLYKTSTDVGDNYYRYENGILQEFRFKKTINIYMNRL